MKWAVRELRENRKCKGAVSYLQHAALVCPRFPFVLNSMFLRQSPSFLPIPCAAYAKTSGIPPSSAEALSVGMWYGAMTPPTTRRHRRHRQLPPKQALDRRHRCHQPPFLANRFLRLLFSLVEDHRM